MIKTKNKYVENCEKDARKFIPILKTADGECRYCVTDLLELFIKNPAI